MPQGSSRTPWTTWRGACLTEPYQIAGWLLRRTKSPHWRAGGTHYSWTNKPRNAFIYASPQTAEQIALGLGLKPGKFEAVPVVVMYPPSQDEEETE